MFQCNLSCCPFYRVQQFEDSTGQKKYANLSQEDYVRALNELRRNLLVAWSKGNRVGAIAVCIFVIQSFLLFYVFYVVFSKRQIDFFFVSSNSPVVTFTCNLQFR